MSIQIAEKIYREIKALRGETQTLQELFFLLLNDPEGKYKKSFIKRILKKSSSKPQFTFVNKNEFLKQCIS